MAKKKLQQVKTLSEVLSKLEEIKSSNVNINENVSQSVSDMEDKISTMMRNTFQHFEAVYYPEWNQCYKDDKLYFWDRYIDLVAEQQEWRTNIKVPLISTAKDTMVWNTYDINSTITAVPKTDKGADAVDEYQLFADSIFYDSDVEDTLRQCIDEAILTGNSYARVWYNIWKKSKQYMKDWKIQTIELEYNKPTLDYVSIYELIFDVWAKWFNNCRWKWYRTIIPFNDAVSKYNSIFDIVISDAQKNMIIKNPKRISDKNYNKIKEIKFLENKIKSDCLKYYEEQFAKKIENIKTFPEDNIFQVDYEYNDLVEVIEYREKDKCAVFFNWYSVYDWINPYPFDDDPFVHLQYEKTTWFIIARWLGQKLRWYQQNIDIISNLYTDAIKIVSAPMFKWFWWKNKDKTLKFKWWWILRDDWLELDAIKLVDFNSINASLNAITKIEWDSDRAAWLWDYTSWWDWGWIERSYGAVAAKVQVLKNRLKPLTNSINRFLTDVIRKMAIMAVTYMPEKFKVRIVWEDWITTFKEITTESLIHDFDILFDNSVAATKELDFAKKLQVLQQIWPMNTDPLRWGQPIVDIKEIISWMIMDASISWKAIPTDNQRVELTKAWMEMNKKMQEVVQEWQTVNPMNQWWNPWEILPNAWWEVLPEWRFDPNAWVNKTSQIANQL